MDQTKAQIIPGIWIGDLRAANDIDFISTEDIQLVVNLSGETVDKCETTRYIEIKMNDFDYIHWLRVTDPESSDYAQIKHHFETNDERIMQLFIMAADNIALYRKNRKNVLVNCFAGINRSATTLASYFIRWCGLSPDDAIKVLVGVNNSKRGMPALTNEYFRHLLTKIKSEHA